MTYGGKKGWSQDVSDTKISTGCLGMGLELNQNRSLFTGMFALHVSESILVVEVKCLWHFERITPICNVWAAASGDVETLFSHLPLSPNRKPVKGLKSKLFDETATHVTPAGRRIFFLLLNLSLRLNLSPCIQHCRDCQLCVQFADALGVFVFCLHNQGNQKSTDGKILGPLKLLRRKQRTMSNLRQPRCSCLATSLPVDSLLLPRLKCVSTRYEISIWLSELLIIEREFSWFKIHPPHT